MSVKKFRFVSPGIFINEIDESQITREFGGVGPVIIGRSERGPGMIPVQVESFSEFVEIFGNPIPGGQGGDVWRNGNYTAPTYAAYAAQAWLRNASPLTFVRLLGTSSGTTGNGPAGWATADVSASGGGAYGLFVAANPDLTTDRNAALAAVIYVNADKDIGLAGTAVDAGTMASAAGAFCTGQWVKSSGKDFTFTIHVGGSDKTFNLNRDSDNFIRNALNTNPTKTNAELFTSTEEYFLGETYERHVSDMLGATVAAGNTMAVLLPLNSDGATQFDKNLMEIEAQAASTPWIFSQDDGDTPNHYIYANTGEYSPSNVKKLFKLTAISTGAWISANLKVAIEDIKAPVGSSLYGTFTVALRKTSDSDKAPVYVERFTNCNLNPSSGNYVAKRIGDTETTWDKDNSRYNVLGTYPNVSKFVRIKMQDGLDAEGKVPFGFYGPAVPRALAGDDTNTVALTAAALVDDAGTANPSAGSLAFSMGGSNFSTDANGSGNPFMITGSNTQAAVTFVFPAMATRTTSSEGVVSDSQASFGITTNKKGSSLQDFAYFDLVKPYSQGHPSGAIITGSGSIDTLPALSGVPYAGDSIFTVTQADSRKSAGDFYSANVVSAFTLDDLVLEDLGLGGGAYTKNTKAAHWAPGSRKAGASISVRGKTKANYEGVSSKGSVVFAALAIHNDVISLKDVERDGGTALQFLFTTSNADGEKYNGETNGSGQVIVGIGAASGGTSTITVQEQIERFVKAVNGVSEVTQATNITLDITATVGANNKIDLVQDIVGTAGDQTITVTGTTVGNYTITSFTGGASIPALSTITAGYKDVLSLDFNKFVVPMVGGFDGLDITEKEPFRNTFLSKAGADTAETNYAFNSIQQAIDSISDADVVEMNLASIPGCTNNVLTASLIDVCENRGDSLAIVDLENDYVPATEGNAGEVLPDVDQAVNALEDRYIDSSYGCSYFPWVQIRDSLADTFLWAPPSVVALGTMASSERRSELWFAPAGFNRGGLTEGSAGIPVVQARLKLTSKDRDKLYEANINPIASFPSEGIVIFGQKTLQVTPSALDRINVRRLLIFLKKRVSRIATGILFDNNVPATWQRFTSQVEPFLASVKSRFGLSDFRVILDETTTTPDLVDRNVLYAKIMLKPARSIEFIAIDFVISKSGASFDD